VNLAHRFDGSSHGEAHASFESTSGSFLAAVMRAFPGLAAIAFAGFVVTALAVFAAGCGLDLFAAVVRAFPDFAAITFAGFVVTALAVFAAGAGFGLFAAVVSAFAGLAAGAFAGFVVATLAVFAAGAGFGLFAAVVSAFAVFAAGAFTVFFAATFAVFAAGGRFGVIRRDGCRDQGNAADQSTKNSEDHTATCFDRFHLHILLHRLPIRIERAAVRFGSDICLSRARRRPFGSAKCHPIVSRDISNSDDERRSIQA
jgi:hypothetical protein